MKNLLIFLLLFLFTGCTARGWYDGMQIYADRECEKHQYQSVEYEECIKNTNISYDQYHHEHLLSGL